MTQDEINERDKLICAPLAERIELLEKELIDAGIARMTAAFAGAEIVALKTALSAAKGYLMNASIDLHTGASKATAIKTIEGGIRLIDKALAE